VLLAGVGAVAVRKWWLRCCNVVVSLGEDSRRWTLLRLLTEKRSVVVANGVREVQQWR